MKYQRNPKALRNVTYTALFAAIICVTTMTVNFKLGGGYYHIGDAFIYLAAVCIPLPYCAAAGAIGGAMADFLSGYHIYILPTFIIKALMTIFFTNKKQNMLCMKNIIAVLAASVTMIAGYYIAEVIISKSFAAALATIPFNGIQASSSALVFVAVAIAMDRISLKQKIFN